MLENLKIHLRAYKTKDIQVFIFFLNKMEEYGIGIVEARALLEGELLLRRGKDRREVERLQAPEDSFTPPVISQNTSNDLCPSCQTPLVRPKGVDEPIVVCPKCRWSEYRGEK